MPIEPIDLQTLFSKLHQVSEEQAAQRDQTAQAQSVAGQEIAKKGTEQAETVTLSEDLQHGPADVSDEEGGGNSSSGNRKRRKRPVEEPEIDVFRDPDLGRNIDISG